MHNLFANISRDAAGEECLALVDAGTARIERIVSHGQRSPEGFWYDQDRAEWVVVLQGRATIRFDDGELVDLQPGDFLDIPAHRRHRVEHTSTDEATIWLAVHYG